MSRLVRVESSVKRKMLNLDCRQTSFKVWFWGSLLAFGFSLFASVAACANSLPTAEDINKLAEAAKLTAETFMQESFELRIRYEFSGRFLDPNDKENLHRLAQKASGRLQTIAKTQQMLKNRIEDYQGNDWDEKYGSTGLWRKLTAELYATNLNKCEIDYYLALASQQLQRNEILHRILAQVDSFGTARLPAVLQLLKAKVFALLARTDPVCEPLAKKEFDELVARSDMRHSTAFRIEIERIKLLGEREPAQLETMAESIAKSNCTDDLELVLSLAFLQRRLNLPGPFERTVNLFPQIEGFLGSLILSDLSHRLAQGRLDEPALLQISIFEAELAVQASWQNEAKDYKLLLDCLSSMEKFQTPLILYVSAAAFAESSPTKAVSLLIDAGKLQKMQRSDRLETPSEEIARQAVQLAYNLFAEDQGHCRVALAAFENYSVIAGEKIDEELEYLYTVVLNDCGQAAKSRELLQKIADRPAGNYRDRARLDLVVQEMQQNQWKDKDSAQKVLDILGEAEIAGDPNPNVLKSKALRQLGRLDESAECLLEAAAPNHCEYTGEAVELLAEIIDRIDRFQKDNLSFMENCKKLAQFCYDCLDGQAKQRAGLFLVEISIFPAVKSRKELSGFEKLLDNMAQDGLSDDVDFIRCRARLLGEQGKFSEASRLWARICKIRKSEAPSANQRSWKWWRAKFYELYCWSKCPETKKENVLHTIEVIENSFTDIPALWAEKLTSLKKEIK